MQSLQEDPTDPNPLFIVQTIVQTLMFNGYIPIWLIFHDCPSSFDRFFSTCQFPICKLVDPNNFLPVGIRFVPKKIRGQVASTGFSPVSCVSSDATGTGTSSAFSPGSSWFCGVFRCFYGTNGGNEPSKCSLVTNRSWDWRFGKAFECRILRWDSFWGCDKNHQQPELHPQQWIALW